MDKTWRVIDTGLRPAAENIALNRALLEARQAGEIPNTLRFLRFRPSALLGYHQSAEQELDLDYCRANHIAVQRRITGGGAIYFDETQIGWELYLTKDTLGCADMEQIARRICEAAARGISALGVEARYRPRNDIEVEGKKISGTGGAFEGNALMYQGTLLLRFDVEKMLRVLRIPAEKLSDKVISSARERVTDLADLLDQVPDLVVVKAALTGAFAKEFGVSFAPGNLAAPELARYQDALAEIDHPDWVNLIGRPAVDMPILQASRKFPGGLLRVSLAFDARAGRIKQVWLSGDFFVSPKRAVADLEAALRNVQLGAVEEIIRSFFVQRQVNLLMLTPDDFAAVIRQAVSTGTASAVPVRLHPQGVDRKSVV